MATFTPAEEAYIQLFNEKKATLPRDLTPSVAKLEITDKITLGKSLYLFSYKQYYKDSAISLGDDLLKGLPQSIQKLNSPTTVMEFHQKTNEYMEGQFDTLFDHLMEYLPSLELNIPRDNSFLKSPANIERTALFMRHLDTNIHVLLEGPPHRNHHTINRERAETWVASQKTEERKRLAQILLDNLRYISHSELLRAIQTCVEQTIPRLVEGPVVFIVGSPRKSNYYISLLFAFFWLRARQRIDCVFNDFRKIDTVSLCGNFLDIDDMSYSGSQTYDSLITSNRYYLNLLRNKVKSMLEHDKDYQVSYMVLPRYILEQTLQRIGFRYIVVRAFMSERSFKRLRSENGMRLPIDIVTAEVIPYMPGVDPLDEKKIRSLFSPNELYSTVYFDHKVADTPSTYLYPITAGIIPQRMIGKNVESLNNISPYVNNVEGKGANYLPFIEHCAEGERQILKNRTHTNFYDLPDVYRCPYAWYKGIDYETGTYTPPPLPHGPTEDNFLGGKRTRKQKHSKKRKTRSKKH